MGRVASGQRGDRAARLRVEASALAGAAAGDAAPRLRAARVEPHELDLYRFRELLAQGRPREALALSRGPALADLAFEDFAQSEIARLEELRLSAMEAQFDHELARGRHAELVGERRWRSGRTRCASASRVS